MRTSLWTTGRRLRTTEEEGPESKERVGQRNDGRLEAGKGGRWWKSRGRKRAGTAWSDGNL